MTTTIFLLSLVVILLCSYGKVDGILKILNDSISFVCKGSSFFYTLTVSLISGIIVYFLTVTYPDVRKSKYVYVEILHSLEELQDDFKEFRWALSVNDWCTTKDEINNAVNLVKHYGHLFGNDTHYSLKFCEKLIFDFSGKLESLTINILAYTPYLTLKEMELLTIIRHQKITERIRYKDGVDNLLTESELHDYFKSISELNNQVNYLHDLIQKRTTKKN